MAGKISEIKQTFNKYSFMFSELVKRDFKQKYKRTVLGMLWSVLSPLLTLLIMKLVFTQFFGRSTPHYTTYLFSGNLVMAYYRESTRAGMASLSANASIITKINVPKPLFILSQNVSALINFLLTLVVYFLFCAFDGIRFGPHMLMLFYPVFCLMIMNIGIGMILSSWFVFYKDISYLYSVFLTLLTYVSAIFYTIDGYPEKIQRLFLCNPVYVAIKYFRVVVIDSTIPTIQYHILLAFYAAFFLFLGIKIYKKNDHEFLYYM